MFSQFIHLGAYGAKPRAGEPHWACIEGITEEGARVPKASRHLAYRGKPTLLCGVPPGEAGWCALALAPEARDAKGRRLRCDGALLVAGIASYPMLRRFVNDDPVEQDIYAHWRDTTLKWLQTMFGEHLRSVVEHDDEEFLHLHFYVVPKLLPGGQLDLPAFHPGREMKAAAAEAGASKKNQDCAYRRGMERFQDDYHFAVGRIFGHARFGAKRRRVSRAERKMQIAMEEEGARQRAALDSAWAELDRKRAMTEIELTRRDRRQMAREAKFRDQVRATAAAENVRLQAAEAEVARLRARLVALEPEEMSPRLSAA